MFEFASLTTLHRTKNGSVVTSRSRFFHLYGDVITAGEALQNLGLCSMLKAFEQGGIFYVPHLLWHRASVFPVSSEWPPHLVVSYDTRRCGGSILTQIPKGKNVSVARKYASRRLIDYLLFYIPLKNFSFDMETSPLPVNGCKLWTYVRRSGPLSRKGSLTSHTCCYIGASVFLVTSEGLPHFITSSPLWLGKDFHLATPAVTFLVSFEGLPPFNRLLRLASDNVEDLF
jgi:hypothetical protein